MSLCTIWQGVGVGVVELHSFLDWVECQLHTPADFLTGKDTVYIERESGWSPEPVWTIWKKENTLPLLWVNPQIFLPVALLLRRIHYPGIYTSHRHSNMQLFDKQINTHSLIEVKNLSFPEQFSFSLLPAIITYLNSE